MTPLAFLAASVAISTSQVTIREPDLPGAVAIVEFSNAQTNGPDNNGTYSVDLNGLSVVVFYTWNANEAGDDRIRVEVPDGFIAIPDENTVPEHGVGELLIFPAMM